MPRKKQLYIKNSSAPFKLSRSKIEDFIRCPRCFYLDRRLGFSPPPSYPFTLNNAVDELLKKEFDIYRQKQKPHPLMTANNLKAVPWNSPYVSDWRDYKTGLSYLVSDLNIIVYGLVDDIWELENKDLAIADYKATSTSKEITLDDDWKISYKRQAEIYQWLLKQKGLKVSNSAYFVYVNASQSSPQFWNRLSFKTKVLRHVGDSSWIPNKLVEIKNCLESDSIPESNSGCKMCNYVKNRKGV